jgi:hypothetical protein
MVASLVETNITFFFFHGCFSRNVLHVLLIKRGNHIIIQT